MGTKRKAKKSTLIKKLEHDLVWGEGVWVVKFGKLARTRGHRGTVKNLFQVIGEKLPYNALKAVKADLVRRGLLREGVYLAHDSMGCPRYAGRGDIFGRLAEHKKAHAAELVYFSFYVVENHKHEREIETLLIRGSGFLLEFNQRKKRVSIAPGDIKDYEAGTEFFERQKKKGKRKGRRK